MSKLVVYCSNCGLQLPITRKALPKHNTIIELVDPHVCLDEPVEFSLKESPVPAYNPTPKGKFAKKLEEVSPSRPFPIPSEGEELKDRRPSEQIKGPTTTAPTRVLNHVKTAMPTESSTPMIDPEEDSPEPSEN